MDDKKHENTEIEMETVSVNDEVKETSAEIIDNVENAEVAISEVEMEPVAVAKKSKLAEANALIEESKEIVSKVDADIAETKVDISKSAEKFDDAKRTFKNVALKNADHLLEKVGFEYVTFDEAEEFELSIDDSENKNFSLQKLSSGKFTGFILAILVALATAGAWIYVAMTKLKIDITSVTPETAMTHVDPVLKSIGGIVIPDNENTIIGAVILGLSALIMAWLVYAIRTSLKSSKNLRVAKNTLDKSTEYSLMQEESKKEMKKVNAHLQEATVEVGNLEMILNEQAATLKRIVHVEGTYEEEKEYHSSSKKVMKEAEKIMRTTEHLIETAVTKDKKLNEESVEALNDAKDVYSEYLSNIYN